jgi:hypothetical protein
VNKNESYGNSVFEPLRVFSKSGTVIDLINNRMDDKITRIYKGTKYEDEDAETDLLGYLILKRVAKKLIERNVL